MEINNGAVVDLPLETGFSTSSEISQMDNALSFMSTYKWEMGDVNAFYVKKQLLSDKRDENGNRIPYQGTVSEVAKQICALEGMSEDQITKEYLFNRFNKDTDIQALSEFTRGVLVFANGKKMTRRVLAKTTKDEHGKRIPSTLDRLAGITGAIHQKLREAEENKMKSVSVAEDTIKDALDAFDQNNKLIKATKTRVAMEVCAIPVDPTNFTVKDGFAGLKGVIYSTNTDTYNVLKSKLHTADDTHLDYLEIKIIHPVITKNANKDINKMQSGLKTRFETFDAAKSPANLLKDFDEDYVKYASTSAQTAADLRSKVMDYREISDEELLSLCKDYVVKNYSILTDDEKEKYSEIVQRFQEVLTAEEIASISNINFSSAPNVHEAESMNGTADEAKKAEEASGIESFGGEGGFNFEGMDSGLEIK